MNLIALIRRRAIVWSWRARYWWLDTPGGIVAQRWALVLGLMVFLVQIVRLAVVALAPRPHNEPAESYGGIEIVVLVIILLISIYVAYRSRPKATTAKAEDANVPTTEDGQAVTQVFGTVWISDEFVLAFKVVGTDPIKR